LSKEEAEIDLASARADSGVAELLGRDDELAQLYALIDGIGQRGGALVVRGEAGIGKSALLEAAAVRAFERDVTVVSATGRPSEARFAFAGLHQLLLPFLEARDRLPQPQRRALETAIGLADGDAPDPFLVGLAALGLLTEAEAKRPLLFLVEDAQWLDGPSAEVVGFVARRLELEPVFVLFAVREGIASAVDESGLPELHLDGLDEESSRALLELIAPDLPSDLKGRILDEAAGNPLALIELPAAAASLDGSLPADAYRYRRGSSRRSRRGSPVSARIRAAWSCSPRWRTASCPSLRATRRGRPRWPPDSGRSTMGGSGSGIR